MLVGVRKLQKLGIKRWILIPKDVYLHKKFGKVTLTNVYSNKVSFLCMGKEETEERTFLTKVFRKGILDQIKEGGIRLKVGENFVERPVVHHLTTKSGTKIRLVLKNREFIPD